MATLLLHVDHTLMNTQSLFFLLGSFHPLETLELAEKEFRMLPSQINTSEWRTFLEGMDRAYYRFVKKVATKEVSRDPLCLFRPRIMEWLRAVHKKKQEGTIKEVFLYTRSLYERSCRFARDVIHCAIDDSSSFITDTIDGSSISFYQEKEDIYWIHHEKIIDQYKNNIQFPYYDFIASFDRLYELYIASLNEERISEKDVSEVVRWLYGSKGSVKRDPMNIYEWLKERTGPTSSPVSLPRMEDVIVSVEAQTCGLERLEREMEWRKRSLERFE